MHPVDFKGTNIVLSKPEDMTDEQCLPLKAMKAATEDGLPYFVTGWKPNKDDLDVLNAGGILYLQVVGNGFPPVALFTVNDNGEIND